MADYNKPMTRAEIEALDKPNQMKRTSAIGKHYPKPMTRAEIEYKAIRDKQSMLDKAKVVKTAFAHKTGNYKRGLVKGLSYMMPDSGKNQKIRDLIALDQKAADADFAKTQIDKTNPVINFIADPSMALGGTTKVGQLVAGAAAGGLRHGDNQAEQAVYGGLASLGLGLAADKAFRGARVLAGSKVGADRTMKPHMAKQGQLLDKENFTLTPGQRSQSSAQLSIEKRQSGILSTAPSLQDITDASQEHLNRKVYERFGVDAPIADEKAVSAMYRNVKDKLDEIEGVPGLALRDKTHHLGVVGLRHKFARQPKVLKVLNKELAEMRRVMPGGLDMKYITERTSYFRAQARAAKKNPTKQRMYNELSGHLEEMASRQILGTAKAAERSHANQLYKEALSVDDATDVASGIVDQNMLLSKLRQRDRYGFNQTTDNPLYQRAKAYNALVDKPSKDVIAPSNLMLQAATAPVMWPLAKGYKHQGLKFRKVTDAFFSPDKILMEKILGFAGSSAGRNALIQHLESEQDEQD